MVFGLAAAPRRPERPDCQATTASSASMSFPHGLGDEDDGEAGRLRQLYSGGIILSVRVLDRCLRRVAR